MKLVTVYSDNFLPLYRLFRDSASRDSGINIISQRIDLSSYKSHGFRKDSWYKAAELKLEHLKSVLLQCSCEEVIAFSDCDVQFFRPEMLNCLAKQYELEGTEFVAVRENQNSYNCGFYFIRRTPKIINLLDETLADLRKYKSAFAEQTVINALLPNAGIKHTPTPDGFCQLGGRCGVRPAMHHAVCTSGIDDKMTQLETVYKWYYSAGYTDPPGVYGGKFFHPFKDKLI